VSSTSSSRGAGRRRCSLKATVLNLARRAALEPDRQVERHYISRRKPTQNAFIESFKVQLRDDPLNEALFASLAQARTVRRRENKNTTSGTGAYSGMRQFPLIT